MSLEPASIESHHAPTSNPPEDELLDETPDEDELLLEDEELVDEGELLFPRVAGSLQPVTTKATATIRGITLGIPILLEVSIAVPQLLCAMHVYKAITLDEKWHIRTYGHHSLWLYHRR